MDDAGTSFAFCRAVLKLQVWARVRDVPLWIVPAEREDRVCCGRHFAALLVYGIQLYSSMKYFQLPTER